MLLHGYTKFSDNVIPAV